MQEKLSLQESKNTFALYEQNALWEQPVAGGALIADILTRFGKSKRQSSPRETEQTDTGEKVRHNKNPRRQTRYQNTLSKSGRNLSYLSLLR